LGVRFADSRLLATALTHRSAGAENYERLEFLGDGILNALIGAELYRRQPAANEGDLSRLRASLVRESTLAEIAAELELSEYVQVGAGETGSHRRKSVLADVLEAIIGAVYIDAGFTAAQELVLGWFASRLQNLPDAESLKDAKTRLQEYLQAREQGLPVYVVLNTTGPAHDRRFEVSCTVPDTLSEMITQAGGSSRRRAEQEAARLMLLRLTMPDGNKND
jgi:ribonuclease-3